MTIQNKEIKRTDTTSPKVNTLADLKNPIVDDKGLNVPLSVWGTDISRTEIVTQNDGSGETLNVGFTDRSGNPQPFGNDVHDYVIALEEVLHSSLNNGEFIAGLNDAVFPCEQRPVATLPTPIQRETLVSRSVRFMSNGVYNSAKNAPTSQIAGGTAVMVAPVVADSESKESGILYSAITHVSDFAMMGGWTAASLTATATDLADQYLRDLTSNVVDVLLDAPDLQSTKVGALSGKASVQADDILDAVAVNLPLHLGSSLTDYTLLVPEKYEAILNRAAQRAGMTEISELVGTAVAPYSGDDRGVLMLPKKYAMLSFRSTREGDLVKIIVTRVPHKSGYDVELIGAVDVMATGSVKVKTGAFDTEAAASYPLIHVLKFE